LIDLPLFSSLLFQVQWGDTQSSEEFYSDGFRMTLVEVFEKESFYF